MLLPSVWSDYFKEYSPEKAVEMLAKAGFAQGELSVNHSQKLLTREGSAEQIGLKFHTYLQELGYCVPQGHLAYKQTLCAEDSVDILKRQLDLFAGIGVHNAVIHVNGGRELEPQERFERQVSALSQLAEYVRGSSIKLCLENLGSVPQTQTVEKLRLFLEAVGSDRLAICLDVGHLHLTNSRGETAQSHREFILKAGKDLRALHITNNNGNGDDHLMPYSARTGVAWQEVVGALREIDYHGLFNLEILGEAVCPMPIRHMKLEYIKKMIDYMLSDEFLQSDKMQFSCSV